MPSGFEILELLRVHGVYKNSANKTKSIPLQSYRNLMHITTNFCVSGPQRIDTVEINVCNLQFSSIPISYHLPSNINGICKISKKHANWPYPKSDESSWSCL